MKKQLGLFLVFAGLLCSNKLFAQQEENLIQDFQKQYYSQVFGFQIKEVFNEKLFDLIDTWLNTPYRYAGKNENGIDCSGFINVLLKSLYGSSVGCSSVDMYHNVPHVSLNKLLPGDLVFFKTRGRRISHVGMYLGQNKFVHSSTSNGVIISDLEDAYYKKRFAKGGRLNFDESKMDSTSKN